MEPKKPNRHERRAALAISRRNRNARIPKENRGPCGVRRYSLRKVHDPKARIHIGSQDLGTLTIGHAAIGIDLARVSSHYIAWLLAVVDKLPMGPDRVDGTVQIDARARVTR